MNNAPQSPVNAPEKPKNRIDSIRASIMRVLTGFIERIPGVSKLKKPEILDGAGLESLDEDIREYKTASGDKIYAATDKGVDYSKDRNEDRVAVSPRDNMAAVIDGVGGADDGDKAAQFLAESLLKFPNNPVNAVEVASRQMELTQIDKDGGACFASVRIINGDNGQKSVEIAKAGDVKVLIFREGNLIWESKDDSLMQIRLETGTATEDEALYVGGGNIVTNAITADATESNFELQPPVSVQKGDLVMLLSDGVTDNAVPKEIGQLVKQGLGPKQIIQALSSITGRRMENKDDILDATETMGGRDKLGVFSDGFLSRPKADNRGVVIFEIN